MIHRSIDHERLKDVEFEIIIVFIVVIDLIRIIKKVIERMGPSFIIAFTTSFCSLIDQHYNININSHHKQFVHQTN